MSGAAVVADVGRDVAAALRRAGVGDVDDSTLARALYSTDASLYRVVPQVVVRPRSVEEVLATVGVSRASGVPLTSRGAGTSIAGNAVGPGIVVDFTRHLNKVVGIDVDARRARVQPGTVHATLQREAAARGLRYGPDPSTHTRCTVGGMIGNNACGSRALAYGRSADTVAALDVVTIAGERLDLVRPARGSASTLPASPTLDALRAVVDADLATVRTEFGTFGRQVSGYSMEHLLPENGFDVATFLAGTEGTLAVMLEAEVDLVTDPPYRVLLLLGYPTMADAADDVMAILPHGPTACEGLDARIVDVVRAQRGASSVPELPAGAGWMFVELAGDSLAELESRAAAVSADVGTRSTRLVTDAAEQAVLWRIREEGAGLAARSLSRPAYAGWEDTAVPPERLGTYLREFEALLRQYDLDGVPYGHFGDGCVHVRIDFPFAQDDGARVFRDFLRDAAVLVAGHGGSLSGEHGDGRARSELLPLMYSQEAISLFGRVKAVLDPDDLLNPGVLVDPAPLDADLRGTGVGRVRDRLALRLLHDDGDLGAAVHRCTGVGKCIADNTGAGGVMCPSFQATREEKDSTRGRARVLQEMVDGRLVGKGWKDPAVHDALDLCLSCKGCARDCPTGIDMATYKAEALHQTYKGRLRPRNHYALGMLPRWARLSAPIARVANLALRIPGLRQVALWLAGVDARRSIPAFATTTLRRWSRSAGTATRTRDAGMHALGRADGRPDVLIWADSFTNYFQTAPGQAAVRVLEAAGYRVRLLDESVCCGLTWISTGQLDGARRNVERTVAALHPYVAAGIPVVGLEPSCLTALRTDAVELTDDPRAAEVAAGVHTLAELLARTEGWEPPDLRGVTLVAQPHCHQASMLGWQADAALLERAGATVTRVGGCCGLAGNFGVEKGHYEVSVKVAEHQLLPAVRTAPEGAIVLADGFSCRTQLDDLADVQALHLAELLDRQARGRTPVGGSQ
ncbi:MULTISPECIES: FAD-binding and (Fe-S)-binding domain-containing protein [Mumia]|uniref:FAD-binding and (Fe-S)-binding domain-containing protein n=1 Tax=Mumia xiangluensis TaxID=1678900 RepID=A0ABW1QNV9_9ACTN|nr:MULTISPECIES: FAD-binding and (Fe-S)-binding domain-containing protein [Mumia]